MRSNILRNFGAIICVAILSISNSFGQMEFPEDKVNWKFTIEQEGDEAYIIGTITMVEHWHIYAANLPEGAFSIPTTLKLNKSSKFKTVGGVIEPKPTHVYDDIAEEDLYYHSNKIVMKRKIKVLSEEDFEISGEFGFQTCDDDHCLQPYTATFKVKVKGVDKKAEETKSLFENAKGDEVKDEAGQIYVKVDDEWHPVPKGNSAAFYKKYLTLIGNDEK